MLGLMLFPVALFNLGTRSLTVPGASSGVPAREFRAELGFPIVMESDSNGSHIYFRRDHEDKLVREALGRHQMANGKWKIENGK